MTKTLTFAGKDWSMTGRGMAASNDRSYVGLVEELPDAGYRWFLERPNQPSVLFSDLDNAHAYITGHRIVLDFIELPD